MGGPRNYHAKRSQSDNETPVSNDMWSLRKGQTELLYRIDTDSQTLITYGFQRRWFRVWGDVLGLWDGNPVKLDCYDHYATTDVINSFE